MREITRKINPQPERSGIIVDNWGEPMSTTSGRPGPSAVILLIAAVAILFPPFHWWFAQGDLVMSLGYIIGSSALGAIAIYVLHALSPVEED